MNSMYSDLLGLDTTPFNSMDSYVFLSSHLPTAFREEVAEAARTCRDMNIADPDDPEDEPELIQVPSNSNLTPATAAKVIAFAKSQAPSLKQAFAKRQRAERAANAQFTKDLAAAGIQVRQHSENEYTRVIVKQLDLQLEGVNPSVNALLHAVFPDDPKKATSIGNSTRKDRRKKAFNSESVRNHPIELAMQLTHGKDSMNQRCSTGTFRQSLGIGRTLFKSCDRITKLEARVQLLEQQMENTKTREALADAGHTTPKEMVLSRHAAGIGPTGIAKELGMELERVRSIISRSKKPSRK